MKIHYTYIEDQFLPGGFAYLPLIDINLGEIKLPIKCLIDSGSPISIIHSPLAVLAGIVPIAGKKSVLYGVGGGVIKGYYHTVDISTCGYTYAIDIFVTAEVKTPYCLLGQIGFFEKLDIDFSLSRLQFEITPRRHN